MNHQQIKTNFRYPEGITDSQRMYGAFMSSPVIREDGDWRDFLPPEEDQNVRGVESSACYIEASQHAIATILEAQFKITDSNYSARFNALLSDGEEDGGDPVKGAKSIKYDGMIPDEMMGFKDIDSWEEFHSWDGVDKDKCIETGKEWTKDWEVKFKIVGERHQSPETKFLMLREALKRSPVPLSVAAWFQKDGTYFKPDDVRDNHLVEAVYLDPENRIYIRDTYAPYLKVLAPNYNFEFGMGFQVKSARVMHRESGIVAIIRSIIASLRFH